MDPQLVAALIAAGVGILTLVGTLAAQYFGRRATSKETKETFSAQIREQREALDRSLEEQREQLDKTLAEQRTRTLNERFTTAAAQLGDDKPPTVRLAGVYAMAGLADDWEENRQVCVDVLCGYLRMPYDPDPGEGAEQSELLAFRASREVRHTVIRVIAAHLVDGAVKSWQGLSFDLSGVVFDGGSFSDVNFSGGLVDFGRALFAGSGVSFTNARFRDGRVSFGLAEFSGDAVDFDGARFSGGRVDFARARFSGGSVGFRGAHFSAGHVDFGGAQFCGAEVSFYDAEFAEGSDVGFRGSVFSGGEVSFGWATVHGILRFNQAEFAGGKVDFTCSKFLDGYVVFTLAKFAGSDVGFRGAEFLGSRVDFIGDLAPATFTAGTVDFSGVRDWQRPPVFPWTMESPLWDTAKPAPVTLPPGDERAEAR